MACNPPNCLEIPPALNAPLPSTLCGAIITWYRIFPITFTLRANGPDAVRAALEGIANAGGTVLNATWFYTDDTGACTIEVDTFTKIPGKPDSGINVTCPPGFVYDPGLEACVLDVVIIPPIPPGGGGGGGSGGGGSAGGGCKPDCVLADGSPGQGSLPCKLVCAASGFDDAECREACCIKCGDPPVDFLELRSRGFKAPMLPSKVRKSIVAAPTSSLARVFMSNPSNRANRDLPGR